MPPARPATWPAGHVRYLSPARLFQGNLGGLAGADDKCQNLAGAAGVPGDYKAWLSDAVTNANDRLKQASVPYVLVNGQPIASQYNDIVDGTLSAPINIDENGTATAAAVWTGTNANGTRIPNFTCNSWTATAPLGFFGNSNVADGRWSNQNVSGCQGSLRLYCLQQ